MYSFLFHPTQAVWVHHLVVKLAHAVIVQHDVSALSLLESGDSVSPVDYFFFP